MNVTKSIILSLAVILILFCSEKIKSQPQTLYFMKGIPQTKDLNPARAGLEEGFYISMPGFSKLDLSANTNGWSYSDLFDRNTNLSLLTLNDIFDNLNRFAPSAKESNFLNESAGLTYLEGGFRWGKNFFSASISDKEFSEIYFHKNLFKLINFINYPDIGNSFNSKSFGVNAQHYREFAFNYSKEINKRFTAGATLKLLFGMSAIRSSGVDVLLDSPPNGNFLSATAKGNVYMSAPITYEFASSGKIINSTPNFELSNYLNNYGNPGLAFDLGFAYKANKKLILSASLIDIGLVSWSTNTIQFNGQGHISYELSDLEGLVQQSNPVTDPFKLKHTLKGFSTFLPLKVYGGAEYLFNEILSFSGLARIRVFDNQVRSSLTASANVLIWKGISLSGSYSMMEGTYGNLGAGVGLRGGPVQIYAVTDNLLSPFNPMEAKNMNLRLGINFYFDQGKEKTRKQVKGSKKDCGCPY